MIISEIPASTFLISTTVATGTIVLAAFTAPEWLTIIASIGGLVVITGGVLVNLIVAWRTSQKVDENTAVTTQGLADVAAEAKVIAGHVNSAATRADAKIEALQTQVAMLLEQKAENKQVAAVLAAGGGKAATDAPAAPVLEQIETNTSDTAKNTARTDATVQNLKDKEQI